MIFVKEDLIDYFKLLNSLAKYNCHMIASIQGVFNHKKNTRTKKISMYKRVHIVFYFFSMYFKIMWHNCGKTQTNIEYNVQFLFNLFFFVYCIIYCQTYNIKINNKINKENQITQSFECHIMLEWRGSRKIMGFQNAFLKYNFTLSIYLSICEFL